MDDVAICSQDEEPTRISRRIVSGRVLEFVGGIYAKPRPERMAEALVNSHGFCPPTEPTIDDHNLAAEDFRDGLDFKCLEIALKRTGPITILFKADPETLRQIHVCAVLAHDSECPARLFALKKMAVIEVHDAFQRSSIGHVSLRDSAFER